MYKYIIMKKNCLNIFYGKEHKESILKNFKKNIFLQHYHLCKSVIYVSALKKYLFK